ncbi:MAG: Flp pilus assembly complex ATPase component TadA [Acetobacteraceae bacterium]|nr:Flp pilus assembly complex ATPase component TadA [Acetobacteraceae bacterium]
MNARDEIKFRLHNQLCHDLGEPVLEALGRPGVNDIMLLEDDTLWVNEGGVWRCDPNARYWPEQRETIIGLVAHSLHEEATFANPIIEGEISIRDRRCRFTGHIPPICAAPTVALRKPAEIVYTLPDYEAAGIITARQRNVLYRAVIERQNILIAGAMGSGKSTLANALIGVIPPTDRVGTIEDTYELQVRLPNRNQLHTTSTIDLRRLVRSALRLQLDRLCVGEVRGGEALDLLKAWNVGARGGIATIHSNDARSALLRLSTLVQEANVPPQPALIAEAIDLIVFIALVCGGKRQVTEILKMDGLNADGNFNLIAVA